MSLSLVLGLACLRVQTENFTRFTRYIFRIECVVVFLCVIHSLLAINLLLIVFYLRGACKDRRSRVTEWVEKAFFDHLNKMFGITTNERNHRILLIDRNLLVVVREPKSYVLPILPRPAPKVLVPGEHHVLKDLPFYKVARAGNAKAHQD